MDAQHLTHHFVKTLALHACLSSGAFGQVLYEQARVETGSALLSSELTGAARPASNIQVTDDFTLDAGASLESIAFIGSDPSNAYAFVIRVAELLPDNTVREFLASAWIGAARLDPSTRPDGDVDYRFDLPQPVRLESGVRYGIAVRALLISPTGGWRWAPGEGDGTVILDELDGSPAFLGDHPGVAFTLLGVSDNAPTCLPDVNGDGSLTSADFGAWVAAYNEGAPAADQNQDGSIDPSDFGAWIANYNEGC